MAKQRKKINLPKMKKPKPKKTKSTNKPLRRGDMYDENGKFIRPYEAYTGPVVNPSTYKLFRDPTERANAKRREEAHRKGEMMYKAKVLIPAHGDVKAHYTFVDKLVQGAKKEEPKENKNSNGRDNQPNAPAEVSGVQEGSDSDRSSTEAGA